MEREKLITSMKKEQKVYSLAHKGKEFLGITQKELTGRMVEHSLMRNDLYIQLNMPYDWQIEVEAKANGEPFIADAVFTRNGEVHFVEIDHQQTMQKNMEKLDRYKVLAKGLWHQRQQHINVIFYTKTDYRKEKLEEYMQGKGIRGKVYVKK